MQTLLLPVLTRKSVCIISGGVGSSGGGKPAGSEGGGVQAAAADQPGRPGLLCTDPSSGMRGKTAASSACG